LCIEHKAIQEHCSFQIYIKRGLLSITCTSPSVPGVVCVVSFALLMLF